MKKVLFYLLVCLIVVFLGLLGVLYFWPDKSSVNDYDLRLSDRVIPKEENAYFDWKQANDLMMSDKTNYDLINDYLAGKIGENNEIDAYLENNKEALVYLERGLEKEYYQNPDYEYYQKANLNTNNQLGLRIVKLGIVKMKKILVDGNSKEALEYGAKLYKIGQMMQEAQDSTAQKTVGDAIKRQLNEQIVGIYLNELSKEEINFWVENIDKYPNEIENEKNGLKMQYSIEKNATQDNLRNGFNIDVCKKVVGDELAGSFCFLSRFGFYWQPNVTIGYVADFARYRIDNLDKNYNELKKYEFRTDLVSGWLADYRTENVVGKTWMFYFANMLSSLEMSDTRHKTMFDQKAYKLILLLKKYELENGKLPENLGKIGVTNENDLLDPYNGLLIKYDSTKRILYSIGKDLEDGGGDKDKDIVFQF